MPNRTLVFVPTYNERENVTPLYERLLQVKTEKDILFLDDASPDGTGEVMDAIAKRDPRVKVIHRAGKLGIGSAHREGIQFAYRNGYDTLITMDADFTHDPALIDELVKSSADLVIPSRYLASESLSDWNIFRKCLTVTGHLLTQTLLGLKNDATGAYRLYRLNRISEKFLDRVYANGYAFFFESLYVLVQNGVRVEEVPISLPKRTYGSSKMNSREIVRSVRQLFSLFVESKVSPNARRV